MSLKIFTLNIEGDRHLERWPNMVASEKPDVLCLQEIFEADMQFIKQKLAMDGTFFPMMNIDAPNKYKISPRGKWGIAIFTNLPFVPNAVASANLPIVQKGALTGYYYAGTPDLRTFVLPNDASRVLAVGSVLKDSVEYTIGTTHFTWSGGGETTDEQRRDLQSFLGILQQFPKIIFCGDFNAPRGGELFSKLEKYYSDQLPKEVTTTIDLELHYAAPLYLVVDTIFSTSDYSFSNVRTISGISDHVGVVGEVVAIQEY